MPEQKWKYRDEGDSVGRRLDSAGLTLDLDDGDHILDAIVLARVSKLDGTPAGSAWLVIGATETCDAIVQSGLINQAKAVVDDVFPEEDEAADE